MATKSLNIISMNIIYSTDATVSVSYSALWCPEDFQNIAPLQSQSNSIIVQNSDTLSQIMSAVLDDANTLLEENGAYTVIDDT